MDRMQIRLKFIVDTAFRVKVVQANKMYRGIIQEALGDLLEKIRMHSIDYLRPNLTGYTVRNPRILRRRYPSVPNALTSRTGKLQYMLKNRFSSVLGVGFTGKGTRSYKKQTDALDLRVTQKTIIGLEEYTAAILYNLHTTNKLFYRGRVTSSGGVKNYDQFMPQETSQTLFFRFKHDMQSLRGGGVRPFLTPAANDLMAPLTALFQRRMAYLKTLFP